MRGLGGWSECVEKGEGLLAIQFVEGGTVKSKSVKKVGGGNY